MTVASELQRLIDSKAAIKTAIENKGVTVDASLKIDSYAAKIDLISQGGGTGDYLVRFIDFDGTILKEQWVNSGQAATAPNTPTHDLLTFDEWNNDFSNITGDLDVGATYRTTSGHTYLFLSFTVPHRLTPSLYLNKSTTDVLNIYDNATGVLLGTTSASGYVTINLTFAAIGDYVLRIECAGVYNYKSYMLGQTLNYELILKNLYIGSVQTIGSYAFYGCYSLQSIVIPSSVQSIGSNAFQGCYSLQSIIIPSSVQSISSYAFQECRSLQSIVIPDGIQSLPDGIFYGCYSLQSIVIPSSVQSIGIQIFQDCHSIKSIVIPDGIQSLPNGTFQDCHSLQSIVIPSSVQSIGIQIFQECRSLQSIVIPSSVQLIGNQLFQYCTTLQSIIIPSSVQSIGSYAFRYCYSLQSVVIPISVQIINTHAFAYCYKIQEYIFEPTTPPTLAGTNAFVGIISVCKIYVPDASVDAYKVATNWVTYATKIFPISTRPS